MAFDMDALPDDVKALIASYTAVTPLQEMATCVCKTDPVYYNNALCTQGPCTHITCDTCTAHPV